MSLRVKRTWRPLHAVRSRLTLGAVRAWLTLGAVRARLPMQAVTAQPGGSAGGGVPGCRRRSARGRLARIAAEAVAAARCVSAGRETGRRLVPVSAAVSRDGPGGGTRPGKCSRPGPAGAWAARSGETALAGERNWTGVRTASRGASLTRECAIGGEESLARER